MNTNEDMSYTGPNGESDRGAVYVYTCSFESCQEESPLLTGEGVTDFGRSLSYFGQHLLVGATVESNQRRKLSQVAADASGADGMLK